MAMALIGALGPSQGPLKEYSKLQIGLIQIFENKHYRIYKPCYGRDIHAFNLAMLAKQAWHLVTSTHSLWCTRPDTSHTAHLWTLS